MTIRSNTLIGALVGASLGAIAGILGLQGSDFPDWLIPSWPLSFHDWAAFALIFSMACFKLDRGTTMKRRAAYIDHFGASIIAFDLVFAATFMVVGLEAIYPRLARSAYVYWGTLIPLFLVMAWQWIEIRLAPHERILISMAGPAADGAWQPGDPDRRTGPPDRRQAPTGTMEG